MLLDGIYFVLLLSHSYLYIAKDCLWLAQKREQTRDNIYLGKEGKFLLHTEGIFELVAISNCYGTTPVPKKVGTQCKTQIKIECNYLQIS